MDTNQAKEEFILLGRKICVANETDTIPIGFPGARTKGVCLRNQTLQSYPYLPSLLAILSLLEICVFYTMHSFTTDPSFMLDFLLFCNQNTNKKHVKEGRIYWTHSSRQILQLFTALLSVISLILCGFFMGSSSDCFLRISSLAQLNCSLLSCHQLSPLPTLYSVPIHLSRGPSSVLLLNPTPSSQPQQASQILSCSHNSKQQLTVKGIGTFKGPGTQNKSHYRIQSITRGRMATGA